MKLPGIRHSRRRHPAALFLALAMPLTGVSVLGGSMSTEAAAAESNSPVDSARWESEAYAEASKTGKRVEIYDRREANVEVFANPDGSTSRRSYAFPVWSKLEGTWRRTDPTLVRQPDGTVTPASPTFAMVFSGGGAAPLATMVKGGKKLALTWPAALPEPVLEGNTALYRSVLPGVDLKVIAGVDGFAEHLLINTPEAAANPAIKSIKFGIQAEGVQLSEDAGGRLLAKDSAGQVVFSAPSPKMWEQPPTTTDSAPADQAGMAPMSLAAADEPAEQPASAPVGTDVSQTTLTLTPDPALLSSADQFPLVVDPVFSDGIRERWAVVYSATPDASYVNGSGWNSSNPADEPRVGHNGTGRTRSFFAMNTTGLEGSTIIHAYFSVIQTYSWGCSPDAAGPTELWSTDSINTPPTWDSQNVSGFWNTRLATHKFEGSNSNWGCSGSKGHDFGGTAFTSLIQQAATNNLGYVTLGLRADADFEGKTDSFHRFQNNPVLQIDYNYKPTLSSPTAYEGNWAPGAEGNKPVACGGTIGNNGLVLTAKLSDADGGKIKAYFSAKTPSGTAIALPPPVEVYSGQTASVTIPVQNNGTGYTWQVYARDEEGTYSTTFGPCAFNVDAVGPKDPVTVTDTKTGIDLADPMKSVTFPARGPEPAELKLFHDAPDLAGFCYTTDFNFNLSVSSTRCYQANWVDADAQGNATITVTPTGRPFSTLKVIAYDDVGNHSPVDPSSEIKLNTAPVDFVYEPGTTPLNPPAYRHDILGDLTGDGYADLVATNAASRLFLYKGDGTGKIQSTGEIGGGTGWGVALVTHRGDYRNFTSAAQVPDGYEDFIVRLPDNRLYLYANNGLGAPMFNTRFEIKHPTKGYDWSGVKQVIAAGNVDGQPGNDMITVELNDAGTDAEAWLYSGNVRESDGGPDQTEPFKPQRTKIGSKGWSQVTLMSVGDVNADGIADIIGRNAALDQLLLYAGQFVKDANNNDVYAFNPYQNYGTTGGWAPSNRPYLTSPGNIQAKVEDRDIDNPDDPEHPLLYKEFVPTVGEEYGDVWATTPADSRTITYVDDTGATKNTTCPNGCLLWYRGWAAGNNPALPKLVGTSGWATSITNIY